MSQIDLIGYKLDNVGLSQEFIRVGLGNTIVERLGNGLLKLGILRSGQKLRGFEDRGPWRRGGAETFVADSMVSVDGSAAIHLIGKAMVSFGTPPEVQLRAWLKRRALLESVSVNIPLLYGAAEGVIFEDFIEEELALEDLLNEAIAKEVARVAVKLDQAGFCTLDFLADMRRHEDKIFYIDFGSDLGEPNFRYNNSARIRLERAAKECKKTKCLEYYDQFAAEGDSGSRE